MANPVEVTDLEARWRTLTTDEQTVAQALLDDAWLILLSRSPGLETRFDNGLVDEGLVRAVIAAMVLRVLRHPDGVVVETVGPFSYRSGDTGGPTGLYVTSDELALLTPTGVIAGAFTIRQTAVPTWSPYTWPC